jgi:hypothetical protein
MKEKVQYLVKKRTLYNFQFVKKIEPNNNVFFLK